MTKDKELLARYANGERDFSGEDLREIKIEGLYEKPINLSNINFSNCNLEKAQFSFIEFSNCNFNFANLTSVYVWRLALKEIRFYQANLKNADLSCCEDNCHGLDFRKANLLNTKLPGTLINSKFNSTNFKQAILREFTNFEGSNFSNLDLSK